MENIFNSVKLKFNTRKTFNLATEILKKLEVDLGENLIDIGYADMTITVFSNFGRSLCVNELIAHQIWSSESFKGDGDYEIIPKE